MSSLASAPPPLHIIRSHSSAISALFISNDNERIYSGDISGLVVITSTRSLRPLASWAAHTDGLLGVEEWGKQVITHGRDNKLHVWRFPSQTPSTMRGSASVPPDTDDASAPVLRHSLDVNALNFCRFSLLPLDMHAPLLSTTTEPYALVAVPNLVDSSLADVWALPSKERIHAAIGKGRLDTPTVVGSDGRGVKNPTGIIMSMHLLPAPDGATRMAERALSLIASYENGCVKLWQYRNIEKERSIEGVGWECLWSSKLHVESIMATAVSPDRSIALSVSADHLVGRYDLRTAVDSISNTESAGTVYRTKHPGNSAVAFREDGRVCAIGGWDGRVRLFSTKSLKPLGTLAYHKATVQALIFAHAWPPPVGPEHHHHRGGNLPTATGRTGSGTTLTLVAAGKARTSGAGGAGTRTGLSAAVAEADQSDAGRSGDCDAVAGGDDADEDSDVNLIDDDDGDEDDEDDEDDDGDDEDEGEGETNDVGDGDENGERGGSHDDGDNDGDVEEEDENADTDEMSAEEKARRSRWLVSGGKDGRVAVWALMDFTREGQ